MVRAFDKMASLSDLSRADVEEFFLQLADLAPGEVGAILGYLLGRLDSQDAATVVSVLRDLHPQRKVHVTDGRTTVNLVGTGGGPSTFNITTTVAFVIAAAGAVVVKTGSGAWRSRAGFVDVAARLGALKLAMPWERIEAIAEEVGIVFVPLSHYAPVLGRLEQHLTLAVCRNAASYLRKLGPLCSPVHVDYQLIGANSVSCLEMLAGACRILGDTPATLVASEDGLDEASTRGRTALVYLDAAGDRTDSVIDPRTLGLAIPSADALRGYEPAAAAECCERILSGKGTEAQTDIVALNAGVALTGLGLSPSIAAGFQTAQQLLAEGEALRKLHQLRERVWKCATR